MSFGQVVIGPPGSGKTTYCAAMGEFLRTFKRDVAIINLDPANDTIPYKCDLNIAELITVTDVMTHMQLGPNGAFIYCMEYLEKNMEWLRQKLKPLENKYLIFDFPGQVELYTHHNSVRNIIQSLCREDNYQLVAVHLVDSNYCTDPGQFISVLMTSLTSMLQMELPHVNLLSKADLIEKHGKLTFGVDFYTEVLDLSYLLPLLQDNALFAKFKRLNEALVGLIEDYSLVSFTAVSVEDKEMMLRVKNSVDTANGYIFGKTEERNIEAMFSCAVGAEFDYSKIQNIREKYTTVESPVEMEDEDS